MSQSSISNFNGGNNFVVTNRFPEFDKEDFVSWKKKAMIFFDIFDPLMRITVIEGPIFPTTLGEDFGVDPADKNKQISLGTTEVKKLAANWSAEDHIIYGLDARARGMLITAVPADVYKTIQDLDTIKKLMDELTLVWEGNEETKRTKYYSLVKQYENFVAKKDESIYEIYTRFKALLSSLASASVTKTDEE